jgi:DNA repair photolyase
MDLRDHLPALLGPIAIGAEVAPGVRLVGASTELGLRLTFVTDDREIHVELAAAADATPHAARTPRLLLAYRSSEGAPVPPAAGQALCARLAPIIARHEDDVLAVIAAEAGATDARIREVEVARVLELAGTPAARFYTLSPYVGCLIGCRFCYAQARLAAARRFAGLAEVPWGSWVDVRVNAPVILAAELAGLPAHPIKFCPIVSDPYHAIERTHELTRRCLEVIAARGPLAPPTILLTRATLVERDAALLARIGAHVGMSVPTFDDAVRAHFEPRAAPIGARLATLARLRDAGVRTCAVIQPQLPGPIDALADALAACVSSVSLDVLRGEAGATPLFDEPRFAHARDPGWQRDQHAALRAALVARGVAVWTGELPPDL